MWSMMRCPRGENVVENESYSAQCIYRHREYEMERTAVFPESLVEASLLWKRKRQKGLRAIHEDGM
jgi:hypothetical protein